MYHGEKLNAWTHLVGAVAAAVGSIWLLVMACLDGSPQKIVSVAIYGVTLVLLYSVSTVYHSVRGRSKVIMQKFDHLSIYLLIAGSYTPFCLVTLHGPWGWSYPYKVEPQRSLAMEIAFVAVAIPVVVAAVILTGGQVLSDCTYVGTLEEGKKECDRKREEKQAREHEQNADKERLESGYQ